MSRLQGTIETETRYTRVETEEMFGIPEFNLCPVLLSCFCRSCALLGVGGSRLERDRRPAVYCGEPHFFFPTIFCHLDLCDIIGCLCTSFN
jgi:hypothetical protein